MCEFAVELRCCESESSMSGACLAVSHGRSMACPSSLEWLSCWRAPYSVRRFKDNVQVHWLEISHGYVCLHFQHRLVTWLHFCHALATSQAPATMLRSVVQDEVATITSLGRSEAQCRERAGAKKGEVFSKANMIGKEAGELLPELRR